jgi:hypothetical protein
MSARTRREVFAQTPGCRTALVVLTLAAALAWAAPAWAIVDGTPTTDPAFAAVASILRTNASGDPLALASGTLITAEWVLTAAHVVADLQDAILAGRAGFVDIAGTRYAVTELVRHPDFDPPNPSADIGLIRLGAAVAGPLPPFAVVPQPLFDTLARGYVLTGESLTILGYGLPTPGTLQVGTAPVSGDFGAFLALDGRDAQSTTAAGDSGGPALIVTGIGLAVVGVHSQSDLSDEVSVEALVGASRSFIDQTTGMAATWIEALPNRAPFVLDLVAITRRDRAVPITLEASDFNQDPVTFEIVSGPAHGSLTGTPPSLTYTPGSGYVGPDVFTFVASDGQLASAPATVSITVLPVPTFVVDRLDDDASASACLDDVPDDCSLRGAILAAPRSPEVPDVVLPAGIYELSLPGPGEDQGLTGDLDITASVNLVGAGAATTVIDGSGLDRVFHVVAPADGPAILASITGVTIRNGHATEHGGAILNGSALILTRVVLAGNTVPGGGGGLAHLGVTATVTDSTVHGNSAASGGGIFQAAGLLRVTGSTIAGNQATAGSGGGLFLSLPEEPEEFEEAPFAQLLNSTISGNTAAGSGGGVMAVGVSLALDHVTITDNTASFGGGVDGAEALSFTARGTIIGGNTDTAGQASDCVGDFFSSEGHNLLGPPDPSGLACPAAPGRGDLAAMTPGLGPLADNGGPTRTHALLSGSPAIDGGDATACPATDQRGVIRPIGAACDIGAFEGTVPAPPLIQSEFFLHGAGAGGPPPILFLDAVPPSGAPAKHRDSAPARFSGGNPWKEIGTWSADAAATVGQLAGLSNLRVWLGLKNSDDIGTKFDLRAEVYKNGVLVALGQTRCIAGLTRNPGLAKEVTTSLDLFSPVDFDGTTDILRLKLLTRIGTTPDETRCVGPGGGHSSAAGLRLYFDGAVRSSGFEAVAP